MFPGVGTDHIVFFFALLSVVPPFSRSGSLFMEGRSFFLMLALTAKKKRPPTLKKKKKNARQEMIQVPQSHLTLGVYSARLGIGVAKSEPTFPVWGWAIVVICASVLLLLALLVYARSGGKADLGQTGTGQMDSVFRRQR